MNKPKNISFKDYFLLKEKYPNNLAEILIRIEKGYPVQYIIGNVEFLDCIIDVDKRVLIPRFETEYFVSKIIDYAKIKFNKKISIIDLGTGSGCIAIALKKFLNCEVTATDISKDALNVAKKNAQRNNVKINFLEQDIIEPLNNLYDIIVSNPPYISNDGYVEEKVLKFEPHLALFAPDKGLYFYKKIISNNLKNLNKPGLMAFELGDHQMPILKKYLQSFGNIKYEFTKDLTGRIRYLFIYNE